MINYKQPAFYHFSQDSIELANYIANNYQEGNYQSLIDLGAGSGVLGLETALKLGGINKISFVELQAEYLPFLQENKFLVPASVFIDIKITKFSEYVIEETFDLVLANPPYFCQGHGRVSKNLNKQKCRTFEVDDLSILLKLMTELRSDKGVACLVIRNDLNEQNAVLDKYNFIEAKSFGTYSIFKLA
jgi:tRNA1Val (adenine37-N6)-methyltransferase